MTTLLLKGVPDRVSVRDLGQYLDKKVFTTNEISSFKVREVPIGVKKCHYALDFEDGFDAQRANEILDGYQSEFDGIPYTIKCKITKDPKYLPTTGMAEREEVPESVALVPFSAAAMAVAHASPRNISDQIRQLRQEEMLAQQARRTAKANRKLGKELRRKSRSSTRSTSTSSCDERDEELEPEPKLEPVPKPKHEPVPEPEQGSSTRIERHSRKKKRKDKKRKSRSKRRHDSSESDATPKKSKKEKKRKRHSESSNSDRPSVSRQSEVRPESRHRLETPDTRRYRLKTPDTRRHSGSSESRTPGTRRPYTPDRRPSTSDKRPYTPEPPRYSPDRSDRYSRDRYSRIRYSSDRRRSPSHSSRYESTRYTDRPSTSRSHKSERDDDLDVTSYSEELRHDTKEALRIILAQMESQLDLCSRETRVSDEDRDNILYSVKQNLEQKLQKLRLREGMDVNDILKHYRRRYTREEDIGHVKCLFKEVVSMNKKMPHCDRRKDAVDGTSTNLIWRMVDDVLEDEASGIKSEGELSNDESPTRIFVTLKVVQRLIPKPRFTLPLKKIMKQMKLILAPIEEMDICDKFLLVLRKDLRKTLVKVLKGHPYKKTPAIVEIFRESYPIEQDAEYIAALLKKVEGGFFDDVTTSDLDEPIEYEEALNKITIGTQEGEVDVPIEPIVQALKKVKEEPMDIYEENAVTVKQEANDETQNDDVVVEEAIKLEAVDPQDGVKMEMADAQDVILVEDSDGEVPDQVELKSEPNSSPITIIDTPEKKPEQITITRKPAHPFSQVTSVIVDRSLKKIEHKGMEIVEIFDDDIKIEEIPVKQEVTDDKTETTDATETKEPATPATNTQLNQEHIQAEATNSQTDATTQAEATNSQIDATNTQQDTNTIKTESEDILADIIVLPDTDTNTARVRRADAVANLIAEDENVMVLKGEQEETVESIERYMESFN